MPAAELVKILAQSGIENVILTACESAKEGGVSSNIAKALVAQGIRYAIGVSYKLLESAAALFTHDFYSCLLSNLPLPSAAKHARAVVRSSAKRYAKYRIEVDVQDWHTFSTYSTGMTPIVGDTESSEPRPKAPLLRVTGLLGRETEMLELENSLFASSNRALIHGEAGIGKTALINDLSEWLAATGRMKQRFYIDFAFQKFSSWKSVIEHLCAIDNARAATNQMELLQLFNSIPAMLVFDSLDSLPSGTDASTKLLRDLRLFVKKIRKSFVVLISRISKDLASATGFELRLGGLKLEPATKLTLDVVNKYGYQLPIDSVEISQFLDQCVEAVEGNPLAIQLLAYDLASQAQSPKKYFHRLTLNTPIALNISWITSHPGARSIIKLQSLVNQSGSSALCIRNVSPFWKFLPTDTRAYWYFLDEAVNRIESERIPFDQASLRLKSAAEDMNEIIERELFFPRTRTSLPAEADSYTRQYLDLLRPFQDSGYVSSPSVLNLGTTNIPRLFHYLRVHPLLNIILRSTLPRLPDGWLYALQVAFLRYFAYKKLVDYPDDGPVQLSDLKENNIHRETAFNFMNVMTCASFSHQLEPTYISVFVLSCLQDVAWVAYERPHRVWIRYDLCKRAVESFERCVEQTRPTYLSGLTSNMINFGNSFLKHFKDRGFIDPRLNLADLWLNARNIYEILCLIWVMLTVLYSRFVSVPYDWKQVVQKVVLGHVSGTDFDVQIPKFVRIITAMHDWEYFSRTDDRWQELIRIFRDEFRTLDFNKPPSTQGTSSETTSEKVLFDGMELQGSQLRQLQLRFYTAETDEEIATVEADLLQRLHLEENYNHLPSQKVWVYERLCLTAFRRGKFDLAREHLKRRDKFWEQWRPGVEKHGYISWSVLENLITTVQRQGLQPPFKTWFASNEQKQGQAVEAQAPQRARAGNSEYTA